MSNLERDSKSDSFTAAVAGGELYVAKNERFTISVNFDTPGVGTIAFERKLDGTAFREVENYTVNTEKDGIAAENMTIRLNCTTFTSGTILGRLGR